jgi:hypothetical protein
LRIASTWSRSFDNLSKDMALKFADDVFMADSLSKRGGEVPYSVARPAATASCYPTMNYPPFSKVKRVV